MVRFFCRHCKFKYTSKIVRNEAPKICTNCGNKGTVEKEPDADQILRMSEGFG